MPRFVIANVQKRLVKGGDVVEVPTCNMLGVQRDFFRRKTFQASSTRITCKDMEVCFFVHKLAGHMKEKTHRNIINDFFFCKMSELITK